MNSSKSLLSSLVIVSALGIAGAFSLGAVALGAAFAAMGVAAFAISDYSRQRRVFRSVRIATGEEPSISHLRLAP